MSKLFLKPSQSLIIKEKKKNPTVHVSPDSDQGSESEEALTKKSKRYKVEQDEDYEPTPSKKQKTQKEQSDEANQGVNPKNRMAVRSGPTFLYVQEDDEQQKQDVDQVKTKKYEEVLIESSHSSLCNQKINTNQNKLYDLLKRKEREKQKSDLILQQKELKKKEASKDRSVSMATEIFINENRQKSHYDIRTKEELNKLPIEGSIYSGDIIDDIEIDRQNADGTDRTFKIKWRKRDDGIQPLSSILSYSFLVHDYPYIVLSWWEQIHKVKLYQLNKKQDKNTSKSGVNQSSSQLQQSDFDQQRRSSSISSNRLIKQSQSKVLTVHQSTQEIKMTSEDIKKKFKIIPEYNESEKDKSQQQQQTFESTQQSQIQPQELQVEETKKMEESQQQKEQDNKEQKQQLEEQGSMPFIPPSIPIIQSSIPKFEPTQLQIIDIEQIEDPQPSKQQEDVQYEIL